MPPDNSIVPAAQPIDQKARSAFAAMRVKMVPTVGFELTTYRLQGGCSTPELCGLKERYFTVFLGPEANPHLMATTLPDQPSSAGSPSAGV